MASISPGPDFVVVSQKTLLQGRKAGIFCGIGVCAGLLVHISYSSAGLTAAFSHSANFSHVIGILGGSYLIFIGYKSTKSSFSKQKESQANEKRNVSTQSAFWNGFIVNVFNPKAAIYFVSLFSIIISPSMSTEKLLFVIISIIFVQMTWYLIFIFIVTIPSVRIKFDNKVYLIDRILGVFMILMGFYMIVTYIFQ
ncbi:LysE family translocator [Marinomonas sp. 2405UD68-3]